MNKFTTLPKSFSEIGLSEALLRAIEEAGYTAPTPIQSQVIPHILEGRDVFGCAQTGTGKTASFTLPMIDKLSTGRAKARMPRSLVLAPTRELAAQVGGNFTTYSKYCNLKQALLIGGTSFVEQEKNLDRGVDVLIATPGRFIDLFERGKILLHDIRILVIDEADRMLDMGFIPEVERILSLLPALRQTLLFSATVPAEIRHLSQTFLKNPIEITVTPATTTAETVTQQVLYTAARNKKKNLRDILATKSVQTAIIFCNRKRDASTLCTSLKRYGFKAEALHGDLSQELRTTTLEAFKKGEIPLLVASDVAARGLDVEKLSYVFNFDVPGSSDDYIHRIGRTGRAGQQGVAITFVTPEEQSTWENIARTLQTKINDYNTGEAITFNGTAFISPKVHKSKSLRKAKTSGVNKVSAGKNSKPAPTSNVPQGKTQFQKNVINRKEKNLPALPNVPVIGFGNEIPAFFKSSSLSHLLQGQPTSHKHTQDPPKDSQ
ncbi:MAG: DEAD/DEAH box helicase [Alphaproteobacteria bacterium]|nr:DEAD/DEAH box helicase [Alphaproteobacteria bacterium]